MANETKPNEARQYRCPQCAALLETDDPIDGMLVACPECGAEFVAEALSLPQITLTPLYSQSNTRRRRSGMKWILLGLVALLAIIAGFAFFGKSAPPSREAIESYQQGVVCLEHENYREARDWLEKAASQGHSDAQFKLGQLFEEGRGGPRDIEEAVSWFRKAAERGHGTAMFRLGKLYEHGNGVPQSQKTANKWYRKAAKKGVADAQFEVAVRYLEKDNYQKARPWLARAAAQHHGKAGWILGSLYLSGEGGPQDEDAALMYFRQAAWDGCIQAEWALQDLRKKASYW